MRTCRDLPPESAGGTMRWQDVIDWVPAEIVNTTWP
jgi:hypothetical protein